MTAILAAAVAVALLAGCGGEDRPALSGMVRDPAPVVDGTALPDVTRAGKPMTLRAPDGGVLLVYFGYTLCPDVCPTTMSDIRLALQALASDERRRVQVALVTVDPDRDTAEVLRRYVRSFVRDGHALRTTDPARLRRVARAFGAGYEVRRAGDGTVEVGHTAFTYAVDDRGRLVLQWSFGTRWTSLRDDLRHLLATTGDGG